jgi:FSR family fosmidomycin resistance protein-like MFS transporter
MKPIKSKSPRSYGLLSLFVVAHFVHHLLTAIVVPLMPLIRSEFALDYTQSGLMVSAFSLSYGIGQLPAGWLADRLGSRALFTVGISGVAVSGLLIGLSESYVVMLVLLALMGVLGGGYHPAAPTIVSALVEPHQRGRALGLHMVGGGASFFLAPIIAAVIAATWGWRVPFIGLALPTFVFGLLMYVLLGDGPQFSRAGHRKVGGEGDDPRANGRLIRLISFLTLSAACAAVFVSVISFIPLYLVDHFGVSEKRAGAYLGLIYSAGLWVSPLGGHLSDRLGRVPIMLAICLIGSPLIYLLNVVPYRWGIFSLLIAIGIIIYIRMPVAESYIVEAAAPHRRATIMGIYYFSSMEAGGVLTPAMGYLIDHVGFPWTFTIAGGLLMLVTLVCSLWLWGSRD